MSDPSSEDKESIARPGGRLLCPGCECEGKLLGDFKQLDRKPKYRGDLNPVYMHRSDKGGCGHIFSPGDPWIIQAFLAGDLVPKALLDDLRATVEALQASVTANIANADNKERKVSA